MKIKTTLFLLSASFVILILALGSIMFMTFGGINRVIDESQRTNLLVKEFFDLDIVTYEYLRHHEKRMLQQWQIKYDSVGKQLENLKKEEKHPEHLSIIESMTADYKMFGDLFSELQSNYAKRKKLMEDQKLQAETNFSIFFEERLIAEILMRSHRIASEAFKFSGLIEQEIIQVQQRANLVIVFSIVGFVIFSSLISFLIARAITDPINELIKGTERIGKGNLEYKIDLKTKNEMGLLANSFNTMTKDLHETTVSRDELEKEVIERMKAEKKIKEYAENLEHMVKERTEELDTALHATEEAKDKIDGIIKSVADGLIVTDTRHRIILMNHAAEDLLAVRLSDVIGRSIDFAVEETTLREKIRYTLDKNTTGYQFDFEWPGKNPKLPRIMRARTSVLLDKNREKTGVVIIIHDVTHEREIDRMKTEFLSTAAHELRTPLTSIQGFSEILMTRDDLSEEERKRFLYLINSQSVSLAKIVRDLLDISRIESRKGLTFKKTKCDIKKIIKNVISFFEGETQIHVFKLDVPKKPVELLIDEDKVEQILKNLIGNSIKYSPEGGEINIVMEVDENCCKLSVKDQGIGMTSEQIEKVFDKFYRANSSQSSVEGTGLGMTIVKYLVEKHDGKVWVESELGKGATVKFTIPFKPNYRNIDTGNKF